MYCLSSNRLLLVDAKVLSIEKGYKYGYDIMADDGLLMAQYETAEEAKVIINDVMAVIAKGHMSYIF